MRGSPREGEGGMNGHPGATGTTGVLVTSALLGEGQKNPGCMCVFVVTSSSLDWLAATRTCTPVFKYVPSDG